jgi:methylenetetrahydrofolate dehydrogenase(NAD+) / 5,10-methenyltetrahydrofolate cyclohydrolase
LQLTTLLSSYAGVPNLITKNMVKQGACVIDVGINRVKNEKSGKTKLVGDVDFEGKSSKIFLLSPTTMSTVCNN